MRGWRYKAALFLVACLVQACSGGTISPEPTSPSGSTEMHIQENAVRQVKATLDYSIVAPDVAAVEWIAFLPRAPETPGQREVSTTVTFAGSEDSATVTEIDENGIPGRGLLRASVTVPFPRAPSSCTIRGVYRARLVGRRLLPGPPPHEVAPLLPTERAAYLRASPTIDFTAEGFAEWLAENWLVKGEVESVLDFARRVLRLLANRYEYRFTPGQNRRISVLRTERATDCAGISFLFVGVMRANGIPARALAGRMLTPETTVSVADYGANHVRAELFAEKIGWVPLDPSRAIATKEVAGSFGSDDGRLLVMHIDPDLAVTPGVWFAPPFNLSLLQIPLYYYIGPGSLSSSSFEDAWKISLL